MENQIGLANPLQELLDVIPGASNEVRLKRTDTLRAKVTARIEATPAQTTGGFDESGQLHGKELAQHNLGPELADQGTDRRHAGVRPRPKRGRPYVSSGTPAGDEGA
jgi:hypothetical protein